jgi:cell wall-associated NlpC family hydrolase/prophage tail gpP-like protein
MDRTALAIVTVQTGKGGLTQHRVQRVENFTTEESIDVDADTFSCQIGDSSRELEAALERDNEVRISLFIDGPRNRLVPVFTGLADIVQRDTDYVMQISGRDTPSSLAVDTDAVPQRWKNLRPTDFLQQRASALGIVTTKIAKKMSPVKTFFSDGSETEWAMWYRLARMRGMYVWTDHLSGGTLYVDKLGYGVTPAYQLGDPPRNQARNAWIPVQQIVQISTKQGRKRRVIIYGATAKKGKTPGRQLVQQAVDTTIPHWRKKPISVLTSTTAKTVSDLHDLAGIEVFESIVGAVEWQLTIHDTGQLIQQNKMAQVNMPQYMLPGLYFVVGVSRQATPDGLVQVVRLRERGFALSKRIPDPPTLQKTLTSVSDDYKPASSIGAALAVNSNIRWPDSFVRATREYGGSWDFAVFLGALLSICKQETGFTNIRQISNRGPNHVEWEPISQFGPDGPVVGASGSTPEGGTIGPEPPANQADVARQYAVTFANDPGNQYNPYAPANAGVGPMQLTDTSIKVFADGLGWNGAGKSGELDGGRWNPDSNIRAGAKLLAEKARVNPPADPTNADDIWIAVQRYNGSGPKAEAYMRRARADYESTFGPAAVAAVSLPKSIPPGSTNTNVNIPGHGVIALPDATPTEARKAISFALRHLGDPYVHGGDGTNGYDCSSLVTAALASAAPYLKNELNYPYPGNHGETTYTLFTKGRFKEVAKDDLLPADLVFFTGSDGSESAPGHMGMYLGDNLFIQDPHSGDVVKVTGLGEKYYVDTYAGARRLIDWTQRPST